MNLPLVQLYYILIHACRVRYNYTIHQSARECRAGMQTLYSNFVILFAQTRSKLFKTIKLLLVLIILPVAFSGTRAVTFIVAILTAPTNKTCELNETVLDYRCTPHRWSCKASGGYDLSIDAAYAIGKLLHVIEFVVFGFYAYKFCMEKEACKNAPSDVWEVLKACEKASILFWCIVVLVVVPYSIIGVPALLYFEVVPEYRDAGCGKGLYHYVLIVHDWMGVPVHSYSVAQRIAMVVACLAVHKVWHIESSKSNEQHSTADQPKELNRLPVSENSSPSLKTLQHISVRSLCLQFRQMDDRLSTLAAHLSALTAHLSTSAAHQSLKKYVENGERIVPILELFKAWFIIQWFAFLATTLADLVNVLKPLTVPINEFVEKQDEWYYVLFHFLYGLLSFIIPYICGSLINKLHHGYYQDLRKKIRKQPLSAGLLVSVEKEEDFDFIPGIHEIGLDIPISNQGYSMSIILALIALVSTLVDNVSNPDYWSFE